MYRFSIILVAVLAALLLAGDMHAQDRRGAGRDRGERRVPQVGRGRQVQRVPRQTNRAPGAVRREQAPVPGRSSRPPLIQERGERPAASGIPGVPQQGRGYHELFGTVQRGLASGSAAVFSGSLAPQVYVNLRGGESGYYSANQAHYVLENYFKTRRLVNVKFSTIGESDANPYATGSATFVERGTRRLAQVYVSLTRSGERWIITQINIY